MTLDFKIKDFFFDRQPVIKAVSRAGVGFLRKSLGAIRKIARNSMKPGTTKGRKRKSAAAGKPPLYHTRDLKDKIFFGFDPSKMVGVAGPVRFKKGTAPEALEFGRQSSFIDRRSGRKKTVTFTKHPYMGPAFEIERPKMPAMWVGAVRS